METRAALNHPLFNNATINRQLSNESLMAVLDNLQEQGNLEWMDKTKSAFYIHWKSPNQWAQLIYAHAVEKGMTNTVCTFYELTSGDDAVGKEFYGLDGTVLKMALQVLEKQGKAALFSHDGSEGVKFL